MFPTLRMVEPTPVKHELFLELAGQPRYIMQVLKGSRQFLCISKWVYLGAARQEAFEGDQHEKAAGTILEVQALPDRVIAWDLLFWKGVDYRGFPLVDRLSKLPEAIKGLKFLHEAPIETDPAVKVSMISWAGYNAVLKDLGSKYDAKIRNWMVRR